METQVKITEKEGWVRALDIEVPVKVVDEAFAQVTEKYKSQAEVPGFRPGKAPIEMVRARYHQAIRQETLEQLLPGAYEHAIKENKIFPLGDPAIDNVVFEQNKPFTFTVEITVRPDVEVVDYKGLKLQRRVYEITDDDVNRSVERFREAKAELVEVTRPVEKGDVVTCDLQKIHDKLNRIKETKFESQIIDLTEDRCAPGFLEALPGMKIGEGKEVEVIFPPDHQEPNLAGNTVLFRAWVKVIRQKNLPPVDDEFARNLGNFSDLNDLKEKVRADIGRNVEQETKKDLREQARKAAVEANKFEVPSALIEDYLSSVVERFRSFGGKVDEEKVRLDFRPLAEDQFRWDYIMHEIAKKEEINVSSEELTAVREAIEEKQAHSDKGQQGPIDEDKLKVDLLDQKVLDYLIDNAETEDVPRVLTSRIVKP